MRNLPPDPDGKLPDWLNLDTYTFHTKPCNVVTERLPGCLDSDKAQLTITIKHIEIGESVVIETCRIEKHITRRKPYYTVSDCPANLTLEEAVDMAWSVKVARAKDIAAAIARVAESEVAGE